MFKIYTLILSLFILTVFKTSAQTFDAEVFVGGTVAQISGDQLAGYHQIGFSFGGVITTTGKKMIGGFGILYNQKGSRAIGNSAINNANYRLRLNYIDVPILLGYKFQKWAFMAGPSINILTKATEKNNFGEIPLVKPFNRVDVTGTIKVSYKVAQKLKLVLSYGSSLLPVRKFDGNGVSYYDGQYNEWITIGVQIGF